MHTLNGAPSSEHWRAAVGSSAENVNSRSSLAVTRAGFSWIVTTGGVMSPISQLYWAGVDATLSAGAIART